MIAEAQNGSVQRFNAIGDRRSKMFQVCSKGVTGAGSQRGSLYSGQGEAVAQVVVDCARELGRMLRPDALRRLSGQRRLLRRELPTQLSLASVQQDQTPGEHRRDEDGKNDHEPGDYIRHTSILIACLRERTPPNGGFSHPQEQPDGPGSRRRPADSVKA